jgi:hypothetical protein
MVVMYVFDPSYFTTYDTPTVTGGVIGSGSVDMYLSDNTIKNVFSTLASALGLLQYMKNNNLYSITPSDDLTFINVSDVKLLILENTFLNQKLMNQYTFVYSGKNVVCIGRNSSKRLSLTDALSSVGFYRGTHTFNNNYDLQTAITNNAERPYIQLVDYHYISNPINSNQGSLLNDPIQIVYDPVI